MYSRQTEFPSFVPINESETKKCDHDAHIKSYLQEGAFLLRDQSREQQYYLAYFNITCSPLPLLYRIKDSPLRRAFPNSNSTPEDLNAEYLAYFRGKGYQNKFNDIISLINSNLL